MILQIAALLVLAVFYACYFLKMLSQRKKGIQTDQMGKGKRGTAQRIEIVLKIMSLVTPMAELIAIILNQTLLPLPARIVGIVLGALGDAVMIAAVLEMKDSWRAGISEDRTDLVTTGVYRFSRNPAFLGFDLMYLGVLLLFCSWWLALITLVTIAVFHIQITKVEEPFLTKVFGKSYTAYCQHVNRYFGRK